MNTGRSRSSRAAVSAAASPARSTDPSGPSSTSQGPPAVGGVASHDVLVERDRGVVLDGDAVVVPDHDQVPEPLQAGQRGRLGGDALLQVAVGGDDPHRVVERAGAGGGVGVEQAALVPLGPRHADRGGQALAERAGGGLDPAGVAVLGVARRERAPGAEGLEVGQLQAVAGQEQLDVEREAGVTARQHEAVPARATPGPPGRAAGTAGTAGRPRGRGSSPCRGGRCRPSGRRPSRGRGRCRRRGCRGRTSRRRSTWSRSRSVSLAIRASAVGCPTVTVEPPSR